MWFLLLWACSSTSPSSSPSSGVPGSAEPSMQGAPEPLDLRLATWNIAWLTDRRPSGVQGPTRDAEDLARLSAHAEQLDADVLALQEVDGPAAAEAVLGRSYRLWFAEGDRVQNVGLAVRQSLLDAGLQVRRHPDVHALDLGGLRPGLDLSLVHGDAELRLLAVHLKAGCSFPDDPIDPPAGRSCEKLADQLQTVERWVDARIQEGVGAVVLGDFNRQMDRPDPAWPALADGEPGALWRVTDGRKVSCRPGGKPLRYVDHIVLGPRATAWADAASVRSHGYSESERERSDLELSDHCPLLVQLQLGAG